MIVQRRGKDRKGEEKYYKEKHNIVECVAEYTVHYCTLTY